jgi:hypothetical protein
MFTFQNYKEIEEYFWKESEKYYQAGLNTNNLLKRYEYWQKGKSCVQIARNLEKLKEK